MKRYLVLLSVVILAGCASAGKPLVKAQVQVAETIKAADTIKLADQLNGIRNDFNGKVSAIEKAVVDFTARADAQIAGIAGVNNKISKTVSELRTGNIGGSFNDANLMKDYIEKLAIAIIVLVGVLCLVFVLGIIEHIIIIVYLLKSDRINDARRERREQDKKGVV